MATGTEGVVRQIIGTVVDVEFPAGQLPELYSAVNIYVPVDGREEVVTTEVQQDLGNNWVRCLAMTSTDGMPRGARAVDTGRPIAVPVGPATLGRLFNVLGEPLDSKGEVAASDRWPIHRSAPPFEEQVTEAQVLETGIKVIEL